MVQSWKDCVGVTPPRVRVSPSPVLNFFLCLSQFHIFPYFLSIFTSSLMMLLSSNSSRLLTTQNPSVPQRSGTFMVPKTPLQRHQERSNTLKFVELAGGVNDAEAKQKVLDYIRDNLALAQIDNPQLEHTYPRNMLKLLEALCANAVESNKFLVKVIDRFHLQITLLQQSEKYTLYLGVPKKKPTHENITHIYALLRGTGNIRTKNNEYIDQPRMLIEKLLSFLPEHLKPELEKKSDTTQTQPLLFSAKLATKKSTQPPEQPISRPLPKMLPIPTKSENNES
jgi:hypothetical protein